MKGKDRILLVLCNGAESVSIRQASRAIPVDSEITLVDLEQCAPSLPNLLEELNVDSNADMDLASAMDEVVSIEASRLAAGMAEMHKNSPELWAARFTELNFVDPVWRAYVTARALLRFVENEGPSYARIVLFGGSRLLQGALQAMSPVEVICFGSRRWSEPLRGWLREHVRAWALWLRNGLNEVGAVLAAKWYRCLHSEEGERAQPQVAIYCNYPSNWSGGDRPQYRFVGRMLDVLERGVTVRYVVSPIHSNSRLARGLRSTLMACARLRHRNEISILQGYSSVRDLWTSYVTRSSGIKWDVVREGLSRMGLGFASPRIRREYNWIDQTKQYALYRAMGRFLDAHPGVTQLLVPIFELAEGRAVVLAARERGVEVIGLQHGAAGSWGAWRLVSAAGALMRAGSLTVPQRIAVEGSLYEKALRRAGFDRIHVTGAPRVRGLPDRARPNKADVTPVILVLLDLHNWPSLTEWALHFAIRNPDVRIVVRSHPKRRQHVAQYCKRRGGGIGNFTLDSISGLNNAVDHHAPHAVIAAETGGVLEFALSSWPCFLFASGSAPLMNPLAWNCPHVRTVTCDPDSMNDLVSFLKSKKLPAYCEQLRICAEEHVQFYGEEADHYLVAILREI